MRLLLAHQAYPPEGGGAELYTEALARTLARDHDVSVLYAERDSTRPDLALRETQRDGVRLLALNTPHAQAAGFESYRDPRVTAAAARLLDERRPDEARAAGEQNGMYVVVCNQGGNQRAQFVHVVLAEMLRAANVAGTLQGFAQKLPRRISFFRAGIRHRHDRNAQGNEFLLGFVASHV